LSTKRDDIFAYKDYAASQQLQATSLENSLIHPLQHYFVIS
jgi:hypothetical protein